MVDLSRRRPSVINNEHETEMTDINTRLNTATTRSNTIHDDFDSREEREVREHLLQTQNEITNNIGGNFSTSCISTDQIDQTGHLPQQQQYGPKPNVGNCLKDNRDLTTNERIEQKKYQVMLLHVQDSENLHQIKKVEDFERILTYEFGVMIERSFAESAFVRYTNVVLIISEELVRVCHLYRNSRGNLKDVCSARTSVILPCIVLDKMEKLISERTSTKPDISPFLHIVCLDNNRSTKQALDLFLKDHSFLNTRDARLYTVYEIDLYSYSEERSPHLKALVDSLKPMMRQNIPLHLQLKIMQLNKDSDSLNSEELDDSL